METLQTWIADVLNYWLGWLMAVLLLGAGVYFGARTLVVQIRMLPEMFRSVGEKQEEPVEGEKGISAFKAFSISAASRVGTGNVAGVAVAITMGGPGAVFWMWMIALLGGATAFIESTLAQLFKARSADGTYRGGPAYYMSRGLNFKVLPVIFAVAITLTYGFVFNSIQSNSIAESMAESFQTDSNIFKLAVGVVLAIITGLIIFGGVRRIADFTQIIVPIMALSYLAIGLLVLVLNAGRIPGVVSEIVASALGLREVVGATVGWAFLKGMQRGLFSNEAGMGSAPNAAATATVSHPVKQGLVQTLGVYFDTILVCSITAFIILLNNPTIGVEVKGATLTQQSLAAEVGGWGVHFVTVILFFLAFSSVIGNTYLAQTNIEYFTQSRVVLNSFRALVLGCVFLGAIASLPFVWALGDTFTAVMVVINLIAIVPLGGLAVKLLRNYSLQKAHGLDPVFHRDMLPEAKNVECWDGSDPVTRRNGEVVTDPLAMHSKA